MTSLGVQLVGDHHQQGHHPQSQDQGGPGGCRLEDDEGRGGRESYAWRSLVNRRRAGEELDETRRFDSQQTAGIGKERVLCVVRLFIPAACLWCILVSRYAACKRVSVLMCASQKDVHHERIGAVLIAPESEYVNETLLYMATKRFAPP